MLYKNPSQYPNGLALFYSSLVTGPALDVTESDHFSYQIYGTWVGTLAFEGSLDKTNWFPMTMQNLNGGVAAAISITSTGTDVNGIYTKTVGHGLNYVRCNTTAYTSGTMGFLISGHRQGRS